MIPLHRSGLLVLVAGWLLTQGLAAAQAFPIKASANGRYLVDAAGIPFLYHADKQDRNAAGDSDWVLLAESLE